MSYECDTDDGDARGTRFQLARLKKKKERNNEGQSSSRQNSDRRNFDDPQPQGAGQFYITDGKIYSCHPHNDGFLSGRDSEYSPRGSKIFRERSSQNQQNSSQVGDSTHLASKDNLREDTVGFGKLTPDSRDPNCPMHGQRPAQYYTTEETPGESGYDSENNLQPPAYHHHHHHHHHMHYPENSNFNPHSSAKKPFNKTESEYEFHATPKSGVRSNSQGYSPQTGSTRKSYPLQSGISTTPDICIETQYKSNFDSVYDKLMENINS